MSNRQALQLAIIQSGLPAVSWEKSASLLGGSARLFGGLASRVGSKFFPAAAGQAAARGGSMGFAAARGSNAGAGANIGGQIARSRAAFQASQAGATSAAAAKQYPRLWGNAPIQGNYGFIPGAKWLGGKLDNWANTGWKGRMFSAIPRRMMPGQGAWGTAGVLYGGNAAVKQSEMPARLEDAGNAGAAAAIRQMRSAPLMDRVGGLFASDATVADYIAQKSPGVARQFQLQKDPEYLKQYSRDLGRSAVLPFVPRPQY